MQNNYFELNQKKLKELLRGHRTKQNLRQSDVADAVGKSLDTYQRWESSGQCLTDIYSLLNVFRALDFSTAEIIDVLSLPPLRPSEVIDVCQDEDTLKSIKENGIYSVMRKECPGIDNLTLKKLLHLLVGELFKRLESGNEKT